MPRPGQTGNAGFGPKPAAGRRLMEHKQVGPQPLNTRRLHQFSSPFNNVPLNNAFQVQNQGYAYPAGVSYQQAQAQAVVGFQQVVQPVIQPIIYTAPLPARIPFPTGIADKGPLAPVRPACGLRQCVCGPGFILSNDKLSCRRKCENRCNADDPCNTRTDTRNKCEWNYGSVDRDYCGNVQCTCAPGYTTTFGAQSCLPPGAQDNTAVCAATKGSDPCQTINEPNNRCLPSTNGPKGYRCNCANFKGYKTGPGKLTCEITNPMPAATGASGACVGHDNCAMAGNPGNVCVSNGGAYTCNCFQAGWVIDFSNPRSILCKDAVNGVAAGR